MRMIAGIAAAALVATALAAPADARRRHHRHHDDVDAGDVIAGAIVVGGLAALFSGSAESRRRKQDAAVDACAGEAELREGGRVGEILGVSRRNGYYTVRGELDGAGGGLAFTCIVRNGSIYSFRTAPY